MPTVPNTVFQIYQTCVFEWPHPVWPAFEGPKSGNLATRGESSHLSVNEKSSAKKTKVFKQGALIYLHDATIVYDHTLFLTSTK